MLPEPRFSRYFAFIVSVPNGMEAGAGRRAMLHDEVVGRLRGMLVEDFHPYLVLRLGNADPQHRGPAPTPRLSSTQTVETLDE